MWRNAKDWWNVYKYRFVPYLVFHLKQRAFLKHEKARVPAKELQSAVGELVKHLHRVPVRTSLPDPFAATAQQVNDLEDIIGFTLTLKKSRIPKAGRGVFVEKGVIQPDTLVALYPGTVYDPGEAILLQSFGNPYIIQCSDGTMIDGKPTGLSRSIYMSCARRDRVHGYQWCDVSWLEDIRANPYAVGQYVNNQSPPGFCANVMYHEFEIPPDFDLNLRRYIPNVHFSPEKDRPLRQIGLVSTRSISSGEELYSNYLSFV